VTWVKVDHSYSTRQQTKAMGRGDVRAKVAQAGSQAGELLAVGSFWSLTMYEATPAGQFFLTPNPIHRYAIGDRTKGLTYGADGSLDIWIGRSDPGGGRSANWLPAPAQGPYSMSLRAYLPKPAFFNGEYRLPPIKKV
jgi:hypothetical protein